MGVRLLDLALLADGTVQGTAEQTIMELPMNSALSLHMLPL